MRKVLRMTDGLIGRLNTAGLALIITMGAVLLAGFGGILGNRSACAGDLADPPPEQSEVRVTFSPNPAKTGFVKDDAGNFKSSLQQHVIATVSPPLQVIRDSITFDQMYEEEGTGRIKDFRKTLKKSGNDKWEFDVDGKRESNPIYPWGDIIISACYKHSEAVGGERVIVQVPCRIRKPHDQKKGAVPAENLGLNCATSPPAWGVDAFDARLATGYYQHLTITVNDQFGEPLGEAYKGQYVFEHVGTSWRNIIQKLSGAGTYRDPVGVIARLTLPLSDPNGQLAPLVTFGGAKHTCWAVGFTFNITLSGTTYTIPTGYKVALPTKTYPRQDYPIRIAGHILEEGIVNRVVKAAAPDQIEIVWPD